MSSQQRLVKTDQILEAVRAFRKVRDHEIAQKEKKSIIDEDDRQERFVNLQLTVKKMSACQKILMIPFTFPHCLLTEEDEICFIVGCKDSEKGNKRLAKRTKRTSYEYCSACAGNCSYVIERYLCFVSVYVC